ncbi:DUF58 domain-containing protein [Microbacterium sp. W1N]|uniref:DUF58 domain-containing protein n=1 Tax=Microbacterium festucae TaxID=2977531 RepID=UPI0021C1F9B0|nr:DUF58 domain-containing protein [Microbacterium festucae]MCT9819250.1 DUF58 domain-containing protein [Microbacterium festucae]
MTLTRDADEAVEGAAPAPSGAPADADAGAAPAGTTRHPTRGEVIRETVSAGLGVALTRMRIIAQTVRPLGWIVIALTVLLWIVSLTFGWEELMIAAVVLTIVAVLCVAFLFGRTSYGIELDLTRTRVVVGERAVGALTLRNTTSRALLPAEVVLPVGSGRGVFEVPRLAPGAAHEELFAIPTTRRGVLSVGPVSVLRADPLGLFERTRDRRQAMDLYVHPRTTNLDGLSLGQLRDLEGLPVHELARDDVSFHALLEYQPGDDLRHVHWKSTARVGELMVRQYEQTRRSHFVIGLSTNPDEYRSDDEFELAVSAAGSIGLRALRDSRSLDVRVQDGPLRAPDGRRYLDALAALEPSRPREGRIGDLAGAVSAHAPGASIAVLITGSRADAAELRQACARLPYETRVLAIVADERVAAPELRRIGAADAVTLAHLDDLPRSVRKVLA